MELIRIVFFLLTLLIRFDQQLAVSNETENLIMLQEAKPPVSPRYTLPGLYENWTRMFRRNHHYRRARADRQSSEQRLMSMLDQYKSKLNTETLALMQEINWNQGKILAEPNFPISSGSGTKQQLTVEQYIGWLSELQSTTDEFKSNLIKLQNQNGNLF